MGKIISPPVPKIVVAAPPPVPEPDAEAEKAAAAEQEREDNLLRRSRGRFSTVLTGFRGLLNADNSGAQKKTLLGE